MEQKYAKQKDHLLAVRIFLQARENCSTEYPIERRDIGSKTLYTILRKNGSRVASIAYDEQGLKSSEQTFDSIISEKALQNLTR